MTFKQNWEKIDSQHELPTGYIEAMIKMAYPDRNFSSYKIISGGCANLNIEVNFESGEPKVILRIYLRDKNAAYREQKLAALLKQAVPVPETYYIANFQEYCFAVTEFIPGITLRDLLLSDEPYDMRAIMYEAGTMLAKIAAHTFPEAGFFDKDLNVIPQDSYLNFANKCLQNKNVLLQLPHNMVESIRLYLTKYAPLLPDKNEKQLVHGDFDPANILMHKVGNLWKVSGILDWEFSFVGSILCDIANMLRYAHQMPATFQTAFLEGIQQNGLSLPTNWDTTIDILNLISLLDCLARSHPESQPERSADICSLVLIITNRLEKL